MNRHVILGSRSILLRTNSLSLHRNMDGPAAASPKDEWVDLADVIIEETIADKKETQKLTPTARVLDDADLQLIDDPLKAPVFEVDDVCFVLRYDHDARQQLRKTLRQHANSYFVKAVGGKCQQDASHHCSSQHCSIKQKCLIEQLLFN